MKLNSLGFVATLGVHQIVCWGTLTYGVTVFAPGLATRAGVSVATIMLVYSLGLLMNGVVAPACTRYVMSGRAWSGGLIGLALGLTSCVVLAFGTHVAFVLVGFALAGCAMALTQYDFAWLMVKLYHPQDARRVVTGITLFGAVASAVMWPIATALEAKFGLRVGWLGLGAIMVVVGGTCLWLLTHAQIARGATFPTVIDQATSVTKPPMPATTQRLLIAGLTLTSTIGGALAVNLPLLLQRFETSPATIVAVLPLFGLGQLLGRGLDFLGARRAGLGRTLKCAGACAVVFWALLFAPRLEWSIALAVLLLGASNGLFTILRGATPQLLFQDNTFTTVSGTLARAGSWVRALMPIVVAYSLESAFPRSVFALICVCLVGTGVFWTWRAGGAALREVRQ